MGRDSEGRGMCVPKTLVPGERYAMFWQRFGLEKSGWDNAMLFTEECNGLSSRTPLSLLCHFFIASRSHSFNSPLFFFSLFSLLHVPAS